MCNVLIRPVEKLNSIAGIINGKLNSTIKLMEILTLAMSLKKQ
jgi:hypothetical protein